MNIMYSLISYKEFMTPFRSEPNPLVEPPFPLSTMTTAQRLRWQQVSQEAMKRQAEIDRVLLENEILRRELRK